MAGRLVPFPSIHAPHAMVASADHLASVAGLGALARGGTAVDAALAASAVLAVTGPHSCGMGGDLFALVHEPGVAEPAVLNASGRAGSGADPERLRRRGLSEMPYRGDVSSVPVPGCVDGWLALHGRFGRLGLEEILAPAITYAQDGFPASPHLVTAAALWPDCPPDYAGLTRPGQRVARPGVARSLAAIARDGREGFYGGEFGAGLLALGSGEYASDDLEGPLADWVTPLGLDVWGHRVWTVPPNSQGYVLLASAWIAQRLPLPDDPDDPCWAHLLIEAAIAAGHDRIAKLHEAADGRAFLDPSRLEARRSAIDPARAAGLDVPATRGDTTYLCAIDGDGVGISLIQSNAAGFGSWLVEPSTGINLHNRGIGFSLVPGHPAEYGPRRRPPHTLAPALVTTRDGRLRALLGTQGGDAQPQILLQLLTRLLTLGQSPAVALSAPRWVLEGAATGFDTWSSPRGPRVSVEDGASRWAEALGAYGHVVHVGPAFDRRYGEAHLIVRGDDHMLAGASDPRTVNGAALGR